MPRRGLIDYGITRPSQPGTAERPKPWTVSQLTRHVKECLEKNFGSLWVEGEVSNVRTFTSGHCYFTLKDEGAQLPAVLWRHQRIRDGRRHRMLLSNNVCKIRQVGLILNQNKNRIF